MRYSAQQYAQALYQSTKTCSSEEACEKMLERFVAFLKKQGALYMRDSIVRAYRTILARHNALPEVLIRVPQEISDDTVTRVLSALDIAPDVVRNVYVDPAILGGMYVKYNNTLLDFSTARSLARLEETVTHKLSNIH